MRDLMNLGNLHELKLAKCLLIQTKIPRTLSSALVLEIGRIVTLFCFLFLTSCSQHEPIGEDDFKIHLPEKAKWFKSYDHYKEAEYIPTFDSIYSNYLKLNEPDTALLYLIGFGEMCNQNYVKDDHYIHLAEQFLNDYPPQPGRRMRAILYYYLGVQYIPKNEYDSSFYWLSAGYNHPLILPRARVKCASQLASIYSERNKNDSAINLILMNIDYYHSKGDTVNEAISFINIAEKYTLIHAYQFATSNLEKALHLSEAKKDTFTQLYELQMLGNLQLNFDEDTMGYLASIAQLNRLYTPYSQKNNALTYLVLQENIFVSTLRGMQADAYAQLGELKSISLATTGTLDDEYIVAESVVNLRFNHTIPQLDNFKNIAARKIKEEKYTYAEKYYNEIAEFYRLKGDYYTALKVADTSLLIQNLKFASNSKGQLYELNIKYETDKKEYEIQKQNFKIARYKGYIYLCVSLIGMIILSSIIFLFYQKNKRIEELRNKDQLYTDKLLSELELERRRIAEELHDSVGHELLNVKAALSNQFSLIEEQISLIIDDVRQICRNIFPIMFEEIGLKNSLIQIAKPVHADDSLYVDLEIDYVQGTLNPYQELNVFRIVQEAISNIKKHAKAKSCKIILAQNANQLNLTIKDNGIGFDTDALLHDTSSFGLLSMNHRCKVLQANFAIKSSIGAGTEIFIYIPL